MPPSLCHIYYIIVPTYSSGHGSRATKQKEMLGEVKDGKMHGHGKITYLDGSVFEGSMSEGLKSGHGTIQRQGWHYEGV